MNLDYKILGNQLNNNYIENQEGPKPYKRR